jgi:polyhydroxyalkanoic acid synthase PhaR subunit
LSQTLPLDPFKMWKSIYDQTEANWNDAIQESLKKETFSEGLGATLNHYLQYQELAKGTTESYLKQVNIPTRGELADVASLVINLEGKVDDLDDKFDKELSKLDVTKEISQLRKAVTNLEKKLDKVLEAIEFTGKENSAKTTK